MLLFGTILFGDKSGAAFSWESACLTHLYRSLCRATRVNCKEMDSPLTLLLTWAWIRLPFLAPIFGNPRVFPIANRDCLTAGGVTRIVKTMLTNIIRLHTTGGCWMICKNDMYVAYGIERIEPDVISLNIRHHFVIWSATVPLISFECIEWHASDSFRRQFGLIQGVPNQERDLGASHGEVLIGPKNQDWFDTYSFWVIHILADDLVHLHYPLEIYMHWYQGAFAAHLQLLDLVFQENPKGPPVHNKKNQQQQPPAPLHHHRHRHLQRRRRMKAEEEHDLRVETHDEEEEVGSSVKFWFMYT
ncbi:hypothetical protein Ahy_A06g026762 [Arachis hypogaea]|uniref:Aminotransferase-like plant mobile domain-containing protein n=1 Tax=Arachis hypogaea TaxID=3818 RepID=A0A445CLK4_ARAHY|nr:hypothetical protein Ahy_A06g026762 [Arachis hypogaea]